jgi:hypothetical protein
MSTDADLCAPMEFYSAPMKFYNAPMKFYSTPMKFYSLSTEFMKSSLDKDFLIYKICTFLKSTRLAHFWNLQNLHVANAASDEAGVICFGVEAQSRLEQHDMSEQSAPNPSVSGYKVTESRLRKHRDGDWGWRLSGHCASRVSSYKRRSQCRAVLSRSRTTRVEYNLWSFTALVASHFPTHRILLKIFRALHLFQFVGRSE